MPTRRSRALIFCGSSLIAAGVTLAPAAANAYTLKQTDNGRPVHWTVREVSYVIDVSRPTPLQESAVKAAVNRSFSAWNGHGADLEFRYGGQQAASVNYNPRGANTNAVVWEANRWGYGSRALALTVLTYDEGGAILDADIVINGVDHTNWSIEPTPGHYTIENVLVHEVGHAAGLDHSDVPEATMFAETPTGGCPNCELHEDDVHALLALYSPWGRPPEPEPEEAASRWGGPIAGCAVAPSTPGAPGGALAALGALVLGLLARRRR